MDSEELSVGDSSLGETPPLSSHSAAASSPKASDAQRRTTAGSMQKRQALSGSGTPSWMQAPMKPGQYAAAMGYKPIAPVQTPTEGPASSVSAGSASLARRDVEQETPALPSTRLHMPHAIVAGGDRSRTSGTSLDSDSESNPRPSTAPQREDKPVHPATVLTTSHGRNSPIEEQIEDYEDDWDASDQDASDSPKPAVPTQVATPAKAASPAASAMLSVMGGSAIEDLMAAAEENERAIVEIEGSNRSLSPTARGLDFGTNQTSVPAPGAVGPLKSPVPVPAAAVREALQDQSYATDSDTEEQEKKRFFEKVEAKVGKVDYAALSARSESKTVFSPKMPSSPAKSISPAKSGSPLTVTHGGGEGGLVGSVRVSASETSAIGGIAVEDSSLIKASGAWSESVTDSPAKNALSDSTFRSSDVAVLLAQERDRSAPVAPGVSSGTADLVMPVESNDKAARGSMSVIEEGGGEGPSPREETKAKLAEPIAAAAQGAEKAIASKGATLGVPRGSTRPQIAPHAATGLPPKTASRQHLPASTSAAAVSGPAKALPKPTPSASPSKVPSSAMARPRTAPAQQRAGSSARSSSRDGGVSGTGMMVKGERHGSGRRQSQEQMGESGDLRGHVSRLKPPTPVNMLLQPVRGGSDMHGAGGAQMVPATPPDSFEKTNAASVVPATAETEKSRLGRVDREKHEEVVAQYEAALEALREEHGKRVEELSLKHDKEIQDTKERNFALMQKVQELEKGDLVKAVGRGAKIPVEISQEERDVLERGLREQEVLITAYQKDNERLLQDYKAAQASARDKDHVLFLENQTLQQRNKKLEEEMQQLTMRSSREVVANDLASKLEVQRVTNELEDQRRAHITQVQELKFEIDRVRKAKKEMEARLGGVDAPKLQTHADDAAKLEREMADLREAHEREKKDLESRLLWYSENQEIVNKNDELLKAQDRKIQDLEKDVARLVGTNKELDEKLDLSGAHGESKLVKSLKKKVSLLEQQIADMKSEPNVVRDLIRAAQPSDEESREAEVLKSRIVTLQKDMEDMENDGDRRMRALRQEMESMRAAYEKRLNTLQNSNKELSNKLAAKHPVRDVSALSAKDAAKQAAEVRSHYQKKLKDVQRELKETQEQLASARSALDRRGGSTNLLAQDGESEVAAVKSEAVKGLEDRIQQARQRIPRTPVKTEGKAVVEADVSRDDGRDAASAVKGGEEQPLSPESTPLQETCDGVGEKWAAPRRETAKAPPLPARERAVQREMGDEEHTEQRIQDLEHQLRVLKGIGDVKAGAREERNAGYVSGWGYAGGYVSAQAPHQEIYLLQQRLAESERAREVAQLALQALEDGAKTVMDEAQGQAQRRIREITKHFMLKSRGEGSLNHATADAATAHHTLSLSADIAQYGAGGGGAAETAVGGSDGSSAAHRPSNVRSSDDVLALRLKVSELERMVRHHHPHDVPAAAASASMNASASETAAQATDRGGGPGNHNKDELSRMEARLAMLEERHQRREKELQDLVITARSQASSTRKRFDTEIDSKNKQLKLFRDDVEEMMVAIEALRNEQSKANTPSKVH